MTPNEILESTFDQGQKYFEWLNTVHGPLDKPVVETIEKTCGVIWNRKGKRLRNHFVYWFSEPYQIPTQTLELYSWAVEAIHTATLLHDDVIDKAEIRRAGPSANNIFDNTLPILSGDYLMSDAIHQLALRGHPELLQGMCLALKELSQGEVLQYQNQFKIPANESFYHLVCKLKTASLLKWAANVGPTLYESSERPHVIRFAETYGLLYQFTDDLLDLKGTVTKERNKDLSDGKLNWAAWKLIQNEPELKADLLKEFSNRIISAQTLERLLISFHKSSQQKQFESFLLTTKSECLSSLNFFGNSSLRHLLSTLVDFTLSRVF